MSSAVCVLKGVPIITTGSLKSRKNGNPGMPIFTGCVYFHDTGGAWPLVAGARPLVAEARAPACPSVATPLLPSHRENGLVNQVNPLGVVHTLMTRVT